MVQRQCSGSRTALIFTTLQPPEPEISDSEQKAMEYLKDIDALAHGLPPVFLVYATALTAPEPGTSDSEQKAMEYLKDIDALAHGLPPVFLVHATSLIVTTSL
ncbi:hypothetical protein GGH93_004553 [Coemansia aciculifera]|nr:hypothetical protein GGH93_004553 [Coemansia aciculifera]